MGCHAGRALFGPVKRGPAVLRQTPPLPTPTVEFPLTTAVNGLNILRERHQQQRQLFQHHCLKWESTHGGYLVHVWFH